jgi:hypothetical protein
MSVRRIEIKQRISPAFGGATFGEVGAYEKIAGCLHMEADPGDPANADIALLALAPRNVAGMVEYSVDFCLFAPVDPACGSGWMFYEFLNRGSQRGIMRINNAPFSVMPETPEQLGNAFLMRQGHVVLWTAWQGNVEPAGGPMLADLPIARQADGTPITSMTREEVVIDASDSIRGASIVETSATSFNLTLSYPAAQDRSEATLTARPSALAPRALPAGVTWRWLDDMHIEIETRPEAGLDRGAIYEFVYRACDPVVMGLGYAGVRDAVTFFRHADHDATGTPNPLRAGPTPVVRRAMGFGLSQSGRVLRDFLWQGFNADPQGRAVFDGVIPIIGGARKAWVNAPFSQPGRYSRQHEDHDFPGDQFPFTYAPLTDPVSGRTDDILARARAAGVCPKLMHLDTDSEIWSARGSLVVTDCEGGDIALPDDVRVYLASGIAHGDYPVPSGGALALPTNRLTYGPILRALIVAMAEWVDDGIAPPTSAFPRVADGSLCDLQAFTEGFPTIPGMPAPTVNNQLELLNHDSVPPLRSGSYTIFVPRVDADGNTDSGVRHPLQGVPLGTHAGWAVRQAGFAPGMLYSVYGSFKAFAPDDVTAAEGGDPRPSEHARYGTRGAWIARIAAWCAVMVRDRLLLPEDAQTLVAGLEAGADPYGLI